MKKLLILPVLILLFAFEIDPEDLQPRKPGYEVTFCKLQRNLSQDQARIAFTVINDEKKILTGPVLMSWNGILDTLLPNAEGQAFLDVKPGKNLFLFYYDSTYAEIYTDSLDIKGGCLTGITLTFSPPIIIYTVDKPVIYVYPDVTREVNIQLNVNGELGFTYPLYNRGWNFTADPDGTIHMNGNEYSYLFWDAKAPLDLQAVDVQSGFIVDKDSLAAFFEAKLGAMNLSPREQQDFITYWCPRMLKNEKSYVHFMFNEEYNSVATLNVTPAPDHIFRVFMIWSDATGIDASTIHEQKMQTAVRDGFTVIEWGGSETGAPQHLLSVK